MQPRLLRKGIAKRESYTERNNEMGTALYIALETVIPGVDTMIDGKMLSKAEEQLAKAATRLGVRPLMHFFSLSADEATDLLGDDVAGIDIPAVQWFSAEEGLTTVDALLTAVDASPEFKAAREDLLECQRVLQEAHSHGVRWHLAIDF
ncbi:MAG: hypothetical protein V4710_18245 [Verrucomicrobiota bacterium]